LTRLGAVVLCILRCPACLGGAFFFTDLGDGEPRPGREMI